MTIIAGDFTGLIKALLGLGCEDFNDIVFVRRPVRIDGRWHCEVVL